MASNSYQREYRKNQKIKALINSDKAYFIIIYFDSNYSIATNKQTKQLKAFKLIRYLTESYIMIYYYKSNCYKAIATLQNNIDSHRLLRNQSYNYLKLHIEPIQIIKESKRFNIELDNFKRAKKIFYSRTHNGKKPTSKKYKLRALKNQTLNSSNEDIIKELLEDIF